MPSLNVRPEEPVYWRSLDEIEAAPRVQAWLNNEFLSYVPEELRRPSRRGFLAFMGASAALAGFTGCRWPRETILPHSRLPDNRTPGEPVKFATAMEIDGYGLALLATSVDGRPIKIDGNDLHPLLKGKSSSWMQASLLSLYDPDRSRGPIEQRTRPQTSPASGGASVSARAPETNWSAFVAATNKVLEELRSRRGAGLAVLASPSDSPSRAALQRKLLETLPQAQWLEWSPLSRGSVARGTLAAFGRSVRPMLKLDAADVVVSLDDDFLYHHPAAIRYAADFASRRKPRDGRMSRLYVAEAGVSLTGSLADERIQLRPSQIPSFAVRIAAALAGQGLESMRSVAAQLSSPPADARLDAAAAQIARDLIAAKGAGVVTAGAHGPAELHALIAWINEALGNAGHTVRYLEEPRTVQPSEADGIRKAADWLKSGQARVILVLGGNPVYDAPADLGAPFGDLLAKAELSIHLSEYDDETSQRCTWHVNQAHYLESWGDVRSYDGTISVVQPLLEPLYGGKSQTELLALVLGEGPQAAYEISQQALAEAVTRLPREVLGAVSLPAQDTLTYWNRALHAGFVAGSESAPVEVRVSSTDWVTALASLAQARPQASDEFEILFRPSYAVRAGEFANCAWLQELPDPLTKLTWDNAAIVSPADASRLGVKFMDRVAIGVGGVTQTLPVFVLPGQTRGVITLHLGYGRRRGGIVAGVSGFDVYPLRRSDGLASVGGAKVTRAAGTYMLATTQDHWMMQSMVNEVETARRVPELFREISLADFRHDAKHAVSHAVHLPVAQKSLWQDPKFEGHRWAMAIDLASCIGCNACISACQAENNIPVVGKAEVEMGRSMHWIRLDRYFRGDPDAPKYAHQPVTCHQCELAPCESVCPVAATVHDSEGLNVMVYNRCIGTRYCSNNCPYKVRRFNWFYNHFGPKHPRSLAQGTVGFPQWKQPSLVPQKLENNIERMVYNPEVTVRSRGVMEKCTFCQQRITRVKIRAKSDWVQADASTRGDNYVIPDGAIRTACQEACPTDAIVFGDLSDPDSRVSRLHGDDRAYSMLEHLHIKPRLRYLARVANRQENGHGKPETGHEADPGHTPTAGHT